jgi:hypothetical protein
MTQAVRLGRVLAAGFCLCGILLAEGCGSGKGIVSGKVLYQGKPVPGGTVSFNSDKGGVFFSPIEEDGSYTIRGIPTGPAKIAVETESFRPPLSAPLQRGGGSVSPEFLKQNLEKMNPQMADPQRAKRYVPIPQQYRDPDKSNLTYEVKSGKQQHDLDLK